MKLMLLIPHVADGGAEKILSQLSLGLAADEIVVTVFEKRIDYPIGGRRISLDLPIGRGVVNRAIGLVRRIARFRKVLRDERPDVVVSFMGEANILNALLFRRPILTVHNLPSILWKLGQGRTQTGLTEWLVRLLYKRATVVAVSEAIKRELIDRLHVPSERIVVIPNSLNLSEIQKRKTEPAEIPWDPAVPVIVTAGRLTRIKGQAHLIEAFAKVRKNISCQLAILGSGELDGELKEVVRKAGVERDVYFLGRQDNPWKYMARATLFVLPSLTEGFGLVLLEAMACGLPVISSDCSGAVRELLAPQLDTREKIADIAYRDYGVLVPVGGEEEMAAAMLRFLQDDELLRSYVEAGLKRVLDFDYPIFLDRYQRLIEHMANSQVGSHPL